jgi:hypothetical protein
MHFNPCQSILIHFYLCLACPQTHDEVVITNIFKEEILISAKSKGASQIQENTGTTKNILCK